MRYETTGRPGEIREVPEVGDCCGQPLNRPGVSRGWQPCRCAGTEGHRTFRCPTCTQVHYDPPHDETSRIGLGTGDYFRGEAG